MVYHYQSCFRLFAGVDALLCIFTVSAWSLTYFRAQNLILLQFEKHDDPNSFMNKILQHKLILRSAGTNDSPQIAADQLRDMFENIHRYCAHFYKTTVASSKLHEDITLSLQIEIITILAVAVTYALFDLIAVVSTWREKTGHKNVALTLLILQTISSVLFIGCGLAFILDPKFCALKDLRDPMHAPIWIFTIFYKPYHLYLIIKYYKELSNRTIPLNGSDSSSTSYSSVTPPPSPNTLKQATHAYEFEKSIGIPNSKDSNECPDPNGNKSEFLDVRRKFNVTNIPESSVHPVKTQVSDSKQFRKILGWGTGTNSRSLKVHPFSPEA